MNAETSGRARDKVALVHLRVRDARQLFDLRDPAPFRERDLDEKAMEYLSASMSDTPASRAVRYVIQIDEPLPDQLTVDDIKQAIDTYLQYEANKNNRQLREHFRRAQLAMFIGMLALGALLTLANLTGKLVDGTWRTVMKEGLTITAWVAMWRPLELVGYDWWPFVQRRRLLSRMMAAEWAVHVPPRSDR